ncbi:GNAT family N-acetyltransferase [Ferrimicrobium sp.]|uniref:GNAT family N-acetyltransferase n=1 Tax=Ferrimicrobium sp. TaxID=2926050 RepID=UPI00262708C2|nr:GNAT family N-acetyltransferase [Ferrimicrobium sp.]
MTDSKDVTVGLGPPSPEVLDLRARILRAGLDPSTANFARDDDPLAVHAVARLGGKVVGVGSLLPEELDGLPGYRVRGMAVEQGYRGKGIGATILVRLLEATDDDGVNAQSMQRGRDASVIWCHARIGARRLYERHGFAVVGDVFVIEGIGPHVLMVQRRS